MATMIVTTQHQPIALDTRRNDRYQPGQLIHSVSMDQDAMQCYYCWKSYPFCCCNERLAKAAYMDIYSNGVEIGKPKFCCMGAGCCASDTSVGGFHHYDDVIVFGIEAEKAEICCPFPYCFVNNCGCCGEAVVMRGTCCAGEAFFAQANQYNQCCTWCPIFSCWCCPISVMYGLNAGEATRAAAIINQAVTSYKRGQWPKEARVAMTMNPALAMGAPAPMVMVAQSPTGQPAPAYADAPQYSPSNKANV